MLTSLDIFNTDPAFRVTSLTDAINKLPYVPKRVGQLGLFANKSISTTTFWMEERSGTVSILQSQPRGGARPLNSKNPRTARNFTVPHFPVDGAIQAAELQNVRAFGGTELQGYQQALNERMADLVPRHDATVEFGRLGALQGVIREADGSVLVNLFTEFGLTQTTFDWNLGTPHNQMKAFCLRLRRAIEAELGDDVYTGVRVLCGSSWFEKFVQHPEVKAAFDKWQDGQFLRDDQRSGFVYCGIAFEEYRGLQGGQPFVPDNEANAFPEGVTNLFSTIYAPANFLETVNTPGLPRYAKVQVMDYNMGVMLHTQSNVLSICNRPKVLVKLTTST